MTSESLVSAGVTVIGASFVPCPRVARLPDT
jgi:hypothetical protein